MDQKIEFINEWKSKKFTFQSLCEAYRISRALGYRLISRFKAEGEKGLEPQSRAPHSVANKTLTKVEMAICDLRAQQRKHNDFLRMYNTIRPHDALGKVQPAKVHTNSTRLFPEKIGEWDYPKDFVERYVCRNGAIRWGHDGWVGVSTALMEKRVGLEEVGDGIWRVYFRQKMLGYFDERVRRIQDDQGRFKRNKV